MSDSRMPYKLRRRPHRTDRHRTRISTAPRITQDEIVERIRIEKMHGTEHDGIPALTAGEYVEIVARREELGELQRLMMLEKIERCCLLKRAWKRLQILEAERERDEWVRRT